MMRDCPVWVMMVDPGVEGNVNGAELMVVTCKVEPVRVVEAYVAGTATGACYLG